MKSLAKSLSKTALKLELEHFWTEIKIAMSWGWNAARGSSRMPRRTQGKQNIRSLWGQLQTHGGSEFHGPKPYTFQQMRWKRQVPNPLWPQGGRNEAIKPIDIWCVSWIWMTLWSEMLVGKKESWHQPVIISTFAKNAIELQVQKQRNYTKLNVSMIQVVIHQRSFLEWFQRALAASILNVCIFSDILAFFRWVSGRFAVGSWKLDVIAFFCHWIVPFQFQSFLSTTLLFLELFSICQVWQRHYFDCF